MFAGTYTALVTPFHKGRVDEEAYKKLINDQVRGGVDGIVPVGTTGESPSLGFDEHIWVIELAVQVAKGRVKVLAGTGANSTTEAVHLAKAAEAAGVDGLLQVAPYYNKPSQEGLFQHFKKIARATRLPIVLYSIPGRCNIAIEVSTVQRLAKACKNIVGIKEAGGDAGGEQEIEHPRLQRQDHPHQHAEDECNEGQLGPRGTRLVLGGDGTHGIRPQATRLQPPQGRGAVRSGVAFLISSWELPFSRQFHSILGAKE